MSLWNIQTVSRKKKRMRELLNNKQALALWQKTWVAFPPDINKVIIMLLFKE